MRRPERVNPFVRIDRMRTRPRLSSGISLTGFVVAIIVFGIALSIFTSMLYYSTTDIVVAKVTGKERVTTTSGSGESLMLSSKYLIFTDKEVFEDTDDTFLWKFNSSDVYGQLQIGSKYRFTVVGWRIPFLSWYRNIKKVELVSDGNAA